VKRFAARWLYGRPDGLRHGMLSWPLALLIIVAIHVVSGYYVSRLTFNNSLEAHYPADAPAVKLRDDLRRDFPTDEVLTVLFRGDDLYGRDFLQRLQRLTEALERHPLVDRVSSITSFERIAGAGDDFAVEPLIDVDALDKTTPDAVRQRVLGDRFVPGLLASRDGRHVAMAVRPKPLSESGDRLQLKVAVAAAINDAGLRPYYAGDAGPVTIDVAQLASILKDSQRFVPLTVAIGLALLWWVVGRLRPVLVGAVAMSTVTAPAIAAIAAFDQPYTMATAILPSLLAAYTVATLLHLYAAIQRAQRSASRPSESIDRAVAETRKPSLYNVLTTGAGLLSLLLVPIPPIQVFGAAGAFGTAIVFVTVQFLVPPLLRRFDRTRWPQRGSGMGRLGRLARRLALRSMRYPKTAVVAFAALMAALYPYTQRVAVETDVLAFFSPQHPINVDTRLIESTLSGVTSLEISLRGEGRDAFQRVETLRRIKQLQQWLEALPEVDRTVSMVDLIEEMHWAMNRERPAFRTLPPTDRLLRQYLLIYDGNDLYELVNRDFDHARIVLNLNVRGTHAVGQAIDKIRRHVDAEPLPGVRVDVGGFGRLLTDQVDLLVTGQLHSFVGAFVQIFVMLTVLWRSAKAATLCMIPNLAPLFFIFVLMGAAGINLDLATVMIASVVLGITIDDTVHLYHGYRERLGHGISPLWAIARSFESSGRAVLATSTVLIAQFALLTASDFIPTANFGLMTALGLLSGLVFEILLLPALLVLSARLPWTWRSALGLRATGVRQPRISSSALPMQPGGPAAMSAPGSSNALEDAASTMLLPVPRETRRVLVCQGDACKQAGAAGLWRHLRLHQQHLDETGRGASLHLTKTSCLGPCRFAPVVLVYPEGVGYGRLDASGVDRIVDQHLGAGHVVDDLALPASASAERAAE
jgi:predicted RND superfamily exporter protein/(2Fe-2S) ferredoxin